MKKTAESTSAIPPKLEAIVFDLGGVVFHYQPQLRLDSFAKLTGESTEKIRKCLIDSGYAHSCDAGRFRGDKAYDEGIRLLGHRLTKTTFTSAWISAFTPNLEIVELIQALRGQYKLALLSNNSLLVKEALAKKYPETMQLFGLQFFSADFGLLKPNQKFFLAALNLIDCDAAQCLFIDDSSQHVAGAASLGIQAIRFSSAQALSNQFTHNSVLNRLGSD